MKHPHAPESREGEQPQVPESSGRQRGAPFRLAYLTSQYPALSHTFVRREVNEIRKRGFSVSTFSVRPSENATSLSPVDQAEASNTVNILPTTARRLLRAHALALRSRPVSYLQTFKEALGHRAPGVKNAVWTLLHFAEGIQLGVELSEKQVEHLHNHFGNSGATVGLLAARYLNIPWSFTIHGLSEFEYPAGYLLASKIRAASHVNCVTHFGRGLAMRCVDPEHWEKMRIVRAGIEPPQAVLASSPKPVLSPPPAPGRLRLVCVARLSPVKGHVGLIRAFAQLVAEGLPVELELLGGGPEQPHIEAEIARLGLEERVLLRGHAPEHEALHAMSQATALVMASFIEGLPCVIMEALALGVPVVAPAVAGIPELVEHGVSGLLFAPSDWVGLAKQMSTLVKDSVMRERLAVEGQRRVEQAFFVDKSVEPWVDALLRTPPAHRAAARRAEAAKTRAGLNGARHGPGLQVARGIG